MVYLWLFVGAIHVPLLIFGSPKGIPRGPKSWLKLVSMGKWRLAKTLVGLLCGFLAAFLYKFGLYGELPGVQRFLVSSVVISTCITYPILEELGRGLILNFWSTNHQELIGLVVSSLAFVLIHGPGPAPFQVYLPVFSVLCGLLTLWSQGSIVPAAVVHVVTNFYLVAVS